MSWETYLPFIVCAIVGGLTAFLMEIRKAWADDQKVDMTEWKIIGSNTISGLIVGAFIYGAVLLGGFTPLIVMGLNPISVVSMTLLGGVVFMVISCGSYLNVMDRLKKKFFTETKKLGETTDELVGNALKKIEEMEVIENAKN